MTGWIYLGGLLDRLSYQGHEKVTRMRLCWAKEMNHIIRVPVEEKVVVGYLEMVHVGWCKQSRIR